MLSKFKCHALSSTFNYAWEFSCSFVITSLIICLRTTTISVSTSVTLKLARTWPLPQRNGGKKHFLDIERSEFELDCYSRGNADQYDTNFFVCWMVFQNVGNCGLPGKIPRTQCSTFPPLLASQTKKNWVKDRIKKWGKEDIEYLNNQDRIMPELN